jgi:hypothetical protein
MRSRRPSVLAALVIAVVGAVGLGAVPASATAPLPLGNDRVLDDVGVLTAAQESQIQERSEALSESTGLDLWVVFVDEFTDPVSAETWANDTAKLNNLGPRQYLLAVATDGRAFYLSGDVGAGPINESQLASIEQQRIAPELSNDNWVGAAIAAADGLEATTGGGISLGGVLFIGLIVVVAGALLWLFLRSRRRRAGAAAGQAAPEQIPTEELARRAASALVQTDDAIKTSEQELGFAKAQFGDAAAAEFEATIAQAKADLDKAFSLQQQLDDDVPDSEQDVRTWNEQIIELCAHANAELDAKASDFDELRQLEQNAPEALTRVQEQRADAGARAAAAAERLGQMQNDYSAAALSTVADNPAQVDQRLAFADEQLMRAQTAIGAGDGGEAAVSIRAAEEAVGQALALEAAVAKLGDDLVAGQQQAATLIAELESDLAAAAALPDPDGRIAGVAATTRQQLESARPLLTGTDRHPLAALDVLEKANAQIDATLTGVRDEQERQRRAAQQLQQLLTHAQAQVSAAEDFITSRRGAVGATARTRLAEAGASMVQARQLSTTDAAQALAAAQRANDLAAQAIQLAQNDVGAFNGGGGFGGGNVMGAVLGGILINSMLGGGGGGRGRSRGGMPPMRSGGGRSGGMSSGSFGGGSTRSRRGGGRF